MALATLPPSVQRARTLLQAAPSLQGGLFDLSRVRGRVVEVSEAGSFGLLSALCELLLEVQKQQESIAWIETGSTIFFPPDLAFRGVDVEALSVVFVPGAAAGLKAADWLLRSGAFGLIVLDGVGPAVDEASLGRLSRMAQDRQTAVVFLTRKKPQDPSVATQVSLRGSLSLGPSGETQWQVTKDKQAGPASKQTMSFHGPFGLY